MKVALIRTALVAPVGSVNNEPSPPLGLAYLSSVLKGAGHEVFVIDATAKGINETTVHESKGFQITGLSTEQVVETIPIGVDVIGFSIMFTHEWIYTREVIDAVNLSFPDSIIIAGGEHPSALPEFLLEDCPSIDYIVIGEGEETAVDLLASLQGDSLICEVEGIAYIDSNSNYVITDPRKRIKEVGQLPYPDWDSVPIDIYFKSNISHGAGFGRNIPILASRGCPYKCTFCSNDFMWTNRYYIRDVDDVINEISLYVENFGINSVQFADLTAILKGRWIVEFSEKIKTKYPELVWTLPSGTRSEALSFDVLKHMASSGLKYLVYAPESGSESTLSNIKKRISIDKMTASITHAISLGIPVRTNFIVGLPCESRRDVFKTIKLAIYYSIIGVEEAPLFPFQPYPGTEIFGDLKEKMGMTLDDNYFLTLISLSTGNLGVPRKSYNVDINRFELYFYRISTMVLTYTISYLIHPSRIVRFFKNFKSDISATIFESRMKLIIKRLMVSIKLAER